MMMMDEMEEENCHLLTTTPLNNLIVGKDLWQQNIKGSPPSPPIMLFVFVNIQKMTMLSNLRFMSLTYIYKYKVLYFSFNYEMILTTPKPLKMFSSPQGKTYFVFK